MTRRLESLMFTLPAAACVVVAPVSGRTLASTAPLGFGRDVDPADGRVIAPGHPDIGESLAGRACVVAPKPGDETDTEALLSALVRGTAPALIVLDRFEPAIMLAALMAEGWTTGTGTDRSLAVIVLDPMRFALARSSHTLTLEADARLILTGPRLAGLGNVTAGGALAVDPVSREAANDAVTLTPGDQSRMDGAAGAIIQAAMQVLVRVAAIEGATRFTDVLDVHLDDIEMGPGSLAMLEHWLAKRARVAVPTTFETPASLNESIVRALKTLGAEQAPFPASPDNPAGIARAAIHVDGAWQRVPMWLGLCIALTGRAPMF